MFSTPLKRIITTCGIILVFFLLWKVTYTQSKVSRKTMVTRNAEKNIQHQQNLSKKSLRAFNSTLTSRHDSLQDFQASEFYRTIVDNNLFRPLGWRPKVSGPAYRLIGTIVPTDVKTDTRAIIQTTAGNKTYIVTIGDLIAPNTTVIDIKNKHVTLNKVGKRTTLKLDASLWINASKR